MIYKHSIDYACKSKTFCRFKNLGCYISFYNGIPVLFWQGVVGSSIVSNDIYSHHFIGSLDDVCGPSTS